MNIAPYIEQPDRDTIDQIAALFVRDHERRCVRVYLQWVIWDRDTERIALHFKDVARSTLYGYLSARGPKLMEKLRSRLPATIKTNSRTKRGPLLLDAIMASRRAVAPTLQGGIAPWAIAAPAKKKAGRKHFDVKAWKPRPSAIQSRLDAYRAQLTGPGPAPPPPRPTPSAPSSPSRPDARPSPASP